MSKNKWQSYKHEEVDSWSASFKDPNMHDLRLILEFVSGVFQTGEREHVLNIEETNGYFPYCKSMGISFVEHMNNVFKEYRKILPVCDTLFPVSRLCYYDIDGNLTEGDVSSMGALLAEVVPYEELDNYQCYDNPPFGFHCDYYPPSAAHLSGGEVFYLTIYTKTDIWRPQTLWYDDDNLELAKCHTPRLNRFITEFKRLTLEFGGEWGDPEYPGASQIISLP